VASSVQMVIGDYVSQGKRHRFIVSGGDDILMEDEAEDQEPINRLKQRITELEAQHKQMKTGSTCTGSV